MVEARDIVDRESLTAWLEARPEETRLADSLSVVSRMMLRAIPFEAQPIGEPQIYNDGMNGILLFRSVLTAEVAGRFSDINVSQAFASTNAVTPLSANASTAQLASVTAESDIALISMASTVKLRPTKTDAAYLYTHSDLWKYLRADVAMIAAGLEPLETPIWEGDPPQWVTQQWKSVRDWLVENPRHDFWIRWYEVALEGRPLTGNWDSHWQMLRDIALIQNEDWEQGAEHVAGLITETEKPYALAMTASNERVVVSDETGLLKLEPVVPLAQDFGRYIRRKLGKALRVFGDHPGNQHTAVLPELRLVREAVEDSGNLPVELYDTCTSVTIRVAARIKDGELPSENRDALIADFLKHIREVGAEIFAEDEETQKAVARQQFVESSDALIEKRFAVVEVAKEIAEVSEDGGLKQLPETAKQAMDKSLPKRIRDIAAFKLMGRMLRAAGTLGWSFTENAVKGAGTAFGKALGTGAAAAALAVAAPPSWHIAFKAILSALGLG